MNVVVTPVEEADSRRPLSTSGAPLVSVQRSAEMGRFAVAGRPVAAGQVLFEEAAFAVGPKPHSPVVCLGCGRWPLTAAQRCALCGWPLCGADCTSGHLHRAECALFGGAAVRFYGPPAGGGDDDSAACMQLDCIAPLR